MTAGPTPTQHDMLHVNCAGEILLPASAKFEIASGEVS